MIVGLFLLVFAIVGSVVYVHKLLHWDDPKLDRVDRRPAPWFQLSSYLDGRVVHLTPMRDGVHCEDEHGDCFCQPSAGGYRTTDDEAGVMYVHRVLSGRLEGAGR